MARALWNCVYPQSPPAPPLRASRLCRRPPTRLLDLSLVNLVNLTSSHPRVLTTSVFKFQLSSARPSLQSLRTQTNPHQPGSSSPFHKQPYGRRVHATAIARCLGSDLTCCTEVYPRHIPITAPVRALCPDVRTQDSELSTRILCRAAKSRCSTRLFTRNPLWFRRGHHGTLIRAKPSQVDLVLAVDWTPRLP